MNMDMNQEKNQKNRSPHHDGGGMLAQVQASVEILSPVPVSGKCGEKDYERLFIREPEVKAREGKMAYVRPEYRVCCTTSLKEEYFLEQLALNY